jgi:hypothetical protein
MRIDGAERGLGVDLSEGGMSIGSCHTNIRLVFQGSIPVPPPR